MSPLTDRDKRVSQILVCKNSRLSARLSFGTWASTRYETRNPDKILENSTRTMGHCDFSEKQHEKIQLNRMG